MRQYLSEHKSKFFYKMPAFKHSKNLARVIEKQVLCSTPPASTALYYTYKHLPIGTAARLGRRRFERTASNVYLIVAAWIYLWNLKYRVRRQQMLRLVCPVWNHFSRRAENARHLTITLSLVANTLTLFHMVSRQKSFHEFDWVATPFIAVPWLYWTIASFQTYTHSRSRANIRPLPHNYYASLST